MIGELVDSLVGVFSPASALKRSHARRVLGQTRRGYDAAKNNRLNSHWRPGNRSADYEMLSDGDTIRARVRDLVRNNPYAQALLRAMVRNVVGTGIKPQSQVKRPDGEFNSEFNETAEKTWALWQLNADVSGRLSFYDIQRLAYREVLEAGECLVHYTLSRESTRPSRLRLELIEADRLASDALQIGQRNPDNGNEIRRGVEVDRQGRVVAFWLYPNHPSDVFTRGLTPERRPARNFLHLFKQTRIGQTRGISDFAPIVRTLKDLHYYTENELVSSAVASCFSVAVKTIGAGADGGLDDDIDDSSTDTDGNSFEYLQPGLVSRLFPDEEVQVINPARANTAANEWIMLLLHQIAAGFGTSYERLTRDYSQTNYSSNRASDLEDRREFRPEQQFLIDRLCRETWRRFLFSAVSDELDGFPTARELVENIDQWTAVNWQTPGWEWVDPAKEIKASSEAIDTYQSTLADEAGKRGKNWRELVDQRVEELEYIQSKGGVVANGETSEVPTTQESDDADDLPSGDDRPSGGSRQRVPVTSDSAGD